MKSRVLGLLSLLFLSAWSMPHRLSGTDFRASLRPRPIILDVSSPAFAAAEDVRLNIYDRNTIDRNAPIGSAATIVAGDNRRGAKQQLKIGTRFSWPVAETKRVLVLPATVISSGSKVDHLRALIASVNEAPPAEVSVTDYAEILVKEELHKRNKISPNAPREILSTTGTTIVVSGPLAPTVKAGTLVLPNGLGPKPTRVIASNISPAALGRNEPKILEAFNPKQKILLAGAPAKNGFEISGLLTFAKGAALIGGRQELTVRHMLDGVVNEEGVVNIPDGSYHISTAKLEGEILAEVRSREGQLLARAKVNLNDLAEKYGHVARIRDLSLTIEPAFSSLQAEVVGAGDVGDRKFTIADAHLRVQGLDREIAYDRIKKQFSDETVVAPSSFIARASHLMHWPTISIAQSGEKFQLQLLQNKVVEALLNITLDKFKAREALEQGLIWGRVMMGLQPVSGAQIRIVGETEKRPIYLNGSMPEKDRTTTAASGAYAFTLAEAGEKMLRVNLGEKLYWPILVHTEKKTVSYADMKIEPRRNVTIKSVEAFTQKPNNSEVAPLGTDEKYFISDNGQTRIAVDTVSGLNYLEAFCDDKHVNIRSLLRSGQTELNFEFVTKEWLKHAREHLGLKEVSGAGAALFFVNGDEYEVTLGAGSEYKDKNIVYFDSTGRLIDQPVDDGGFVVLNEPSGLQSITVIPQKSKKVITRLVYFDDVAVANETISLTY